MTYKELIKQLAKKENFDAEYTIKHLTVSEVFNNYDLEKKNWDDKADNKSLLELNN